MNDRLGNAIAAGDEVLLVGRMRAESGTKIVVVLDDGTPVHVRGAGVVKGTAVGDTAANSVPKMSQHVDAQDPGNAGLPVKMTGAGNLPTHSHTTAQVTGLDAALAGKAAVSHTHEMSEVTDLETALGEKSDVGHTHTGTEVDAATTSARGTVELATDGENAANVVVQGNDSRVNKARRTLAQTLDSAAVNTSTAEITLCDLTVAANTLGTTGAAELLVQGYMKNNTGGNVTLTFRVYWGGTVYWGDIFTVATGTAHRPFEVVVRVQALSSTSKQSVRGYASIGSSATGSVAGLGNFGVSEADNPFSHDSSTTYPNKATTSAQNVKVTAQMGTSSANAEVKLDVAHLDFVPGA